MGKNSLWFLGNHTVKKAVAKITKQLQKKNSQLISQRINNAYLSDALVAHKNL